VTYDVIVTYDDWRHGITKITAFESHRKRTYVISTRLWPTGLYNNAVHTAICVGPYFTHM